MSPIRVSTATHSRRRYLSGEPAGTARALVVAIIGPPGIGKTELAVAAAHRAVSHYPDGQRYAELRADQPSR